MAIAASPRLLGEILVEEGLAGELDLLVDNWFHEETRTVLRAVVDDGLWQTRSVTSGEIMDTYRARDLMRLIAETSGGFYSAVSNDDDIIGLAESSGLTSMMDTPEMIAAPRATKPPILATGLARTAAQPLNFGFS